MFSENGLQGQPTSSEKLIDSNRQLQDSNAALTFKVKSLEEQIAAVQALLHANQTDGASCSPSTSHTPAQRLHGFDQVTVC